MAVFTEEEQQRIQKAVAEAEKNYIRRGAGLH
jgi:anti-sigma regulatory factor (Ser/Thr protein kinase)